MDFLNCCINKKEINYFTAVNISSHNHISDNELLQNYYATVDNKWLGVLLQRYTLLLLGVCMKYLKNEEEAKDAVQQVFLKVLAELPKYKVDFFKSWLYMIARNHCLMQLRGKTPKLMREINDKMLLKEEEPQKNLHVEKEKMLNLVEASLDDLNDEQKTCVTLFYLQKKSYTEISSQTGYTLMQVKSNIQNGKRNLKILVEKKLNNKNG